MTSWRQIQAVSGLTFGIFLVLHLVCHYTLLHSWEFGNHTMLHTVRKVYQTSYFEFGLLLLPLLMHWTSNGVIYAERQKFEARKKPRQEDSNVKQRDPGGTLELKAHRYAGYFLTLSIVGHVFATRLSPLMVLNDPSRYDYTFVKLVNDLIPFGLFRAYLIIFGMCANWHLIYGTRRAIATLRGRSSRVSYFPMELKVLAMIMHVLIFCAVLAVTGHFYEIPADDNVMQDFVKLKRLMGM